MNSLTLKKVGRVISKALDIFNFQTKKKICKLVFRSKANSILYLGGKKKFIWNSTAFERPIEFILNVEDDYFAQFIAGSETTHEIETLTEWTRIAKQADIVIDCGAYFGLFTNSAAMTFGPNLVISVEPNISVFQILGEHVIRNGTQSTVRLINAAISNETGTSQMMVPEGRSTSSGAQLVNSKLSDPTANWVVANEIYTTTLDSLLEIEELSRVSCIKIDVEGFELEVLLGARAILASAKPALFIEVLHYDSFLRVKELLEEFGYNRIHPLDGKQLSQEYESAVIDPTIARNYLFQS